MKPPAFLICASLQQAHSSNGILGLAHLAKTIEKLGRSAFICQIIGDNDENIYQGDIEQVVPQTPFERYWIGNARTNAKNCGVKYLTDFTRERIESSYVLYPDSVLGNPLAAPNVIRFFGNRDGLLKNGAKVARHSNDFIVTHSRVMTPEAHHVCTFTWMNPIFNRKGSRPPRDRVLDLTYVGKGSLFGYQGRVPDTIEITRTWPESKDQLATILRHCRFLYTADSCSHMNNEALACGAIPVFLQTAPWTDEELDAFEGGAMPRLRPGDVMDDSKFVDFEVRRDVYLAGLAALEQRWDGSVQELIAKVDRHFAGRLPVRTASSIESKPAIEADSTAEFSQPTRRLSRKERKRWKKQEAILT